MHQSQRMRLRQRKARLLQQEYGPLRRQRTVTFDQPLQVHAAQPLHHVVEAPRLGHAEVEQLHRVRRLQLRGRLRLAREALTQGVAVFAAVRSSPPGRS